MFLNAYYRKMKKRFIRWLTYEPPVEDEILPFDYSRLKHEIKPGDVLLFEGRSIVSGVIRRLTQSSWTHAGLYIGRIIDYEDEKTKELIRQYTDADDTTRLLIEDLMDKGTVITPLSKYRRTHIRICRPSGITHSDTLKVIRFALNSLGQPYNVRQLLDMARFLLPWGILPRRWASSLFRTSKGEPESGICSSLIANAFSSVHFPILPFVKPDETKPVEMYERNPYLFTPKDFDFSPYFEIIKYPLFNPDEPLPYYRRLPWTRSRLLHQDEGILKQQKQEKKSFFKKDESNEDDKSS